MSTDRGTIISPHISPTLSIDTDSKKPVINLVQNFPKARALPAPRPACVLWKWLSKSVIVNCVIACTALYCGLYWHDWRLESDQCKSSQNGSSAPNWCFQIIVTKEWDFSSSAPTHSMVSCFLLSGPTLRRQISDNDGILHSCLWSIQNFKSNSICLGSALFNVWLSK